MKSILEAYGFSSHTALVAWIGKQYGLCDNQYQNEHRVRRERIAQRLRLYRDDGKAEFERLITRIFTHSDVIQQRQAMIEVATEQNVTARIAHEIASLYDRPAVRTLANASRQESFDDLCISLELDEIMQEAQRLTFVCNETLLWRTKDDDGEDELKIITPDAFDAIPNPQRKLREIGFLIDAAPGHVPEGVRKATLPHFELWDAKYRYLISGEGKLVDENGQAVQAPIEHKLRRIPGVLLHRRKPNERLLDDRAGRDITSAHLGVGLLEVMAMRLAKSQGEQQPVLKGNLARYAMGQSADGEKPLMLPPEVTAEMLNAVTDPEHYLKKKREKITGVGATYGISYEQFFNQESGDSGSGKTFQLRRMKLTELREEQRRRWLVHERQVFELLDEDPKGASVDYQEQTIPLDAGEEMDLLEKRTSKGLDSEVKYMRRKNPGWSKKRAMQEIEGNLDEHAIVIDKARKLNQPANATVDNPGQTPEQNGADNAPEDPKAAQEKARADAKQRIQAFAN